MDPRAVARFRNAAHQGHDACQSRAAQCDRIYDGAAAGPAWVWDVAEAADGQPIVVYARLNQEADQCHFARWDGNRWEDQELDPSAGEFPRKPNGERGNAAHYSGGIALDQKDPFTCYVSHPVYDVFEIDRLTSADKGKTWRSEPLTANSKQDNVRPVVVRNRPADQPALLWMNNETYSDSAHYRATIKMAPGQRMGYNRVGARVAISAENAPETRGVRETIPRDGGKNPAAPAGRRAMAFQPA